MTYDATDERIKENERQALLRSLHALVPPQRHDNDPYSDVIEVMEQERLGSKESISIYRARMKNKPVAAQGKIDGEAVVSRRRRDAIKLSDSG